MIALAIRYLLSRRRQTLLMLLGFFFGTAAFVLMSGIMLGFRMFLVYQLINNDAHVHIEPREEFLTPTSLDRSFYGGNIQHVFWWTPPSGRKDSATIENPQAWYKRLDADPRVAAYTPHLTAAVIFRKGRATASATLIGCNPRQQLEVTTIGDYVIEGDFSHLAAGGNRIVLGDELRKRLGLALHQNVMVSLSSGEQTPFKVIAVFRTGNSAFDSRSYGALADVQAVNDTPNQVNEIAVRLHDYELATSLAQTWSQLSDEKIQSWDVKNGNIRAVFKIQDAVRFLSIGAIMIVAGFGMYNVLNLTVMQKRKDIAILRSMGYSARDIITLFLSQGLILGAAGTALGLSFGYGMSFYLETIPIAQGPIAIGVSHLILSRDPTIYLHSALLALTSASIASLLPAQAAASLPPIEIIRAGAE